MRWGTAAFTLGVFGLAAGSAWAAQATATPGPVGAWHLDEGTGTTAADATGTGHTGTLSASGCTWIAGGKFGGAITFDGTSGYIQVSTLTGMPTIQGAKSYSWWEEYTAVPAGNANVISLELGGAACQAGFRGGQQVVWGSGGGALVQAAAPAAGGWHHVAYTFDGTTHTLYIDNVVVNTSTAAAQTGTPTALNFGRYVGGEYYGGSVDEIQIYARALTAAEVSTLYNNIAAPTGLTATPGPDQISLSWQSSPNATSYSVLRGTTMGGPYSPIATGITGLAYLDTTVTYPNVYFYVVVAVNSSGTSGHSNEVSSSPLQPPVSVSPQTLSVAESGGTTSFTLTATVTPWSGSFQVTVSSTNSAQVLVSTTGAPAPSVVVTFQSTGPASQVVTVTGVDDFIVGDPQTVTVTVGAIQNSTDTTNYPNSFKPSDVSVSVLETDTAGILVGPPSGPVVDGGTAVTFAVTLNSMPTATTSPPPPTSGVVVLDVSNSAPQVCTVSPTTLSFNDLNWNSPQLVTITPLNDNGQNPAVFFAVQSVTVTLTPDPSTTDPVYAAMGPVSATAPFVDPNPPPTLPQVWNGGGGGCGLTGAEAGVLMLLALLQRRRRRSLRG